MKRHSQELGKLDRKTIEKNRRNHMKGLCFELASLIPAHTLLRSSSKLELFERATTYIYQLRDRIEELKERKEEAENSSKSFHHNSINNVLKRGPIGSNLPGFELREMGSAIELVLVDNGMNKGFMLHEVIRVLQDEGAEVVSLSSSVLGSVISYTIHSQVRIGRVGVETRRLRQRLEELVYCRIWKMSSDNSQLGFLVN